MAVPTNALRQRLRDAAYVLRIREGTAPHPVPGNPIAQTDGSFPLPTPPGAIRPRQASRIGIMETPTYSRVDEQGLSPPEWEIEGQFLLTPRRANGQELDMYGFQRGLEHLIRYYLLTNRQRGLAEQQLLVLEWHDFYMGEHWQVAPAEVPLGQRDNARPITETYRLRLRGIVPTARVDRPPDPVLLELADPSRALRRLL